MGLIIDAHCHISSNDYDKEEIDNIVKDAKISGIKYLFDSGFNLKSSKEIMISCLEYPEIYGVIGIHPEYANIYTKQAINEIKSLAEHNPKIIGIGEIGLDYYDDNFDKTNQKKLFTLQLLMAKTLDLPVILHIRDKVGKYNAYDDCLTILKKLNITKGLMHCFSGTYNYALKFIELGFYISISGIVTFKNSNITKELVKKISLDKILVETDAPFLTPVPYRGHTNFSKYIIYTIKAIAKIKNLPTQEVVNHAYNNAIKLFNIK